MIVNLVDITSSCFFIVTIIMHNSPFTNLDTSDTVSVDTYWGGSNDWS